MANEKRLIDANAIQYRTIGCGGWGMPEQVVSDYEIDKMPTVDAVEVVRCKDCKHWCTVDCAPNYGSCSKLEDRYKEDSESSFDETTRFDDFCSYGERKDNDNNPT